MADIERAAEDEQLLRAAGRGDRGAFTRLVERHQRAVHGFIARLLPDSHQTEAEDLAQDVFIAAWQAAPRYTPQAKVTTWLFRIATNRCFNFRRGLRWRAMRSLEADEVAEPLAPEHDRPEQQVLAAERLARLQSAMAQLPEQQRAALVLRHQQDMAYADIAEVLGTSVSAVESLLFRARRNLQATLGDSENEPQVGAPRRV